MNFIVYSQIREENLHSSLGLPEYSYYIVLKGFLPVLKELGQVHIVKDPEKEVDCIYDACRKRNEDCVFITFSPPHKSTTGLRCPTFSVLAWEFSSIPEESWDNNPKNDWRTVLSDHGRLITLSRYTVESVKKSMGENFPVAAIPSPVWDSFENFRKKTQDPHFIKPTAVTIKGNIIDSRNYRIAPDAFDLKNASDGFELRNWSGEKLRLDFSITDEARAYLGGFFEAEEWGSWSRIKEPWILLPRRLSGSVQIKISACGYGKNIDRQIFVSLGNEKKSLRLNGFFTETDLCFQLSRPESILKFSGLDLKPIPGAIDPRSMGIGLRYVEIMGQPDANALAVTDYENKSHRQIQLDGVIYTSVFNPIDGRKNWEDMITAFCSAFQEVEDATLILKMSNNSLASFLGELHFYLQQLWPFKCRIVALQGYLNAAEYEKLIAVTDYYVNTSRCEGLCLPLMEFMSCHKPVLSPCHTAMADYMDTSSALIIKSSLEPCTWPHDSRPVFRTMRYRIDWQSLVNAYQQSYWIAKNQPETYRQMADSASKQIKMFASNSVVKNKLHNFLSLKLGNKFSF